MSTNLATLMMDDFRGDTIDRIASAIGETSAKTQSALKGMLPAILGTLASKASTSDGANDLLNVIHQNKLDTDQFGSVPSALGGTGITNMMDVGRPLLSQMFGGRITALTDWISSFSGMRNSSASSLLSMALPMVLASISKRIGGAAGGARGLMNLLGEQRSYLSEAPAGLGGVLNPTTTYTPSVPKASSSAWLWPVLLMALLGGLWYWLARRTTVVETARNSVASLGAFIEKALPSGTVLRIPSNGVESKVLGFIQDPSRSVDSNTWFSLDRIEFDTASAQLRSLSQEQLRNIASIMQAYPLVNLKIGGYTDNVGPHDQNIQLSQARALNTMNAIISHGIDSSRLSAEGYGEQYPVADNSTEEGRQRNRRIDVRVTQK